MRITGELSAKPPRSGGPDAGEASSAPRDGKPAREDRIEISDASRKLGAELDRVSGSGTKPAAEDVLAKVTPALHERIAGGFYDRKDVTIDVARKISSLLVGK